MHLNACDFYCSRTCIKQELDVKLTGTCLSDVQRFYSEVLRHVLCIWFPLTKKTSNCYTIYEV